MYLEEMKCISVLLRNAIKGEALSTNALSVFDNKEEFQEYKSNLFTLVSINEVLKSFNDVPSFSLSQFLETGVIPGLYDQETRVPEIGFMKYKGTKAFYNGLIESLKNNDYSFDSSNYLNIYNDDMVATIPQVWLYRLGQGMQKDKYERVFFFNKNKPERIRNKADLIEYLRRTKTFLVELSTSKKDKRANLEFSSAEAKTNYELKNRKDVSLEEVMKAFSSFVSSDFRSKISKYKVSDEFFLIRRAEQLGEVFYDEPIEVQEKFLNKWILERINSKVAQNSETQKFILLSNLRNSEYNEAEDLNMTQVIPGLFSLYINMLMAKKIDLSYTSLSDFKLKAYMDEETQWRKKHHKETESNVLLEREMLKNLSLEAKQILKEINELDVMRDFDLISQKRARYVELVNLIEGVEKSLASVDVTTPVGDVAEIAFDNDKIMSLINEATRNGRIYLEKDMLVVELYNKDITVPVFKTTINIDRMLDFIENMNMNLEEFGVPSK